MAYAFWVILVYQSISCKYAHGVVVRCLGNTHGCSSDREFSPTNTGNIGRFQSTTKRNEARTEFNSCDKPYVWEPSRYQLIVCIGLFLIALYREMSRGVTDIIGYIIIMRVLFWYRMSWYIYTLMQIKLSQSVSAVVTLFWFKGLRPSDAYMRQ